MPSASIGVKLDQTIALESNGITSRKIALLQKKDSSKCLHKTKSTGFTTLSKQSKSRLVYNTKITEYISRQSYLKRDTTITSVLK